VDDNNLNNMKNRNIINICSTLILAIFLTACHRQVKNNPPIEQMNVDKTEKIGNTKLKKSDWAKDHDNILSSLKNSKGQLWFGTSIGLFCFDGKTFTLFQNKR
jgi:ligand-binding sensor domain-containing protein